MSRLKEIQYNILKEIVGNEPLSAYDIHNSLNSDYGNINRNMKKLLENGYITEAERIKGKTNNEKILYGLTEKGMIKFLLEYILIKDLPITKKPQSELIKHKEYISDIFLKYPLFFPSISKNIKLMVFNKFRTSTILQFDITFYAISIACGRYLREEKERNWKSPIEYPESLLHSEREIKLGFHQPEQLLLNECFEQEMIKHFILDPSLSIMKVLPGNMVFMFRLSEIFNDSDELKELILDYFCKKQIYHEDFSKYYSSLSEIGIEVEDSRIFDLLG